jgi:hypothetical protein
MPAGSQAEGKRRITRHDQRKPALPTDPRDIYGNRRIEGQPGTQHHATQPFWQHRQHATGIRQPDLIREHP